MGQEDAMTKKKLPGDLLSKTVLPLIAALFLFSIFSRIFTSGDTIDYFLV